MKQDHQTTFGRHVSAVCTSSTPTKDTSGLWDKWHLLTALTQTADTFGLTHRSLSVLRALMSFHPDRLIGPARHSAIVFPANNTLSQRLGGMPESTLRRHLAALVSAGIVSRHDSANRKRFARGARAGQGRIAFGFDLSPLARLGDRIEACAEQAQHHREQMHSLRAELAALRQQVINTTGPCAETEDAFKLLRRKPQEAALKLGIDALNELLEAAEVSSTDSQNERHIQHKSKIYSDGRTTDCANFQTPRFEDVVVQCTEYLNFFPQAPHSWQDLSKVAYELAPMLGIDREVFDYSVSRMGPIKAITAILCILENLSDIHNPGGYLRNLTQQDAEGRADFHWLLYGKPSLGRNCQLTINK